MRATFLDPGLFKTPLILEQAGVTPDGQGGHLETWAEVTTVFALVEPILASAVFGADQSLETITHRVSMRKRTDIVSGMRFRKGVRLFGIVTVHDPDESGRYLVCRVGENGL